MKDHPEANEANALEPTIGEQLRYAEFCRSLEKASTDDLLEIAKLLGKQALVTQPSVIRFLAKEAANNLAGGLKDWTNEARLIEEELKRGLD